MIRTNGSSVNTSSCARRIVRPNKLKLWSFEQKKVYCKALLGDKVACTLKSQVDGGREVQKEGMYVYLWLIHVDVWQNLTVLLSDYPSIKNKHIKKKKKKPGAPRKVLAKHF